MGKISGGCLCGAVRYDGNEEPAMVAICHCKECQKQSGSAFSVNVGVPTASLSISGSGISVFESTGTSGQPVRRRFCSQCGSSMVSEAEAYAGLSFLKAGTLDDSSWVKPTVRIWCDTAQPWGEIDADMPQVGGNP